MQALDQPGILESGASMPTRTRKIAEMSPEELEATLKQPTALTSAEMDARFPQLKGMHQRTAEAIADLQRRGIYDTNGQLIPPKELPVDMRPDSKTEC